MVATSAEWLKANMALPTAVEALHGGAAKMAFRAAPRAAFSASRTALTLLQASLSPSGTSRPNGRNATSVFPFKWTAPQSASKTLIADKTG